ncbi:MAG: ATP-binding protein [Acidimicrobiales bacterium]
MRQRVVTVLFTDLEHSTRRWLEDEDAMGAALARHDAILRAAVAARGGDVLKHTGDGMLAVFDDPLPAAEAAISAQRTLRADPDGDHRLRTRMALHTGPCTERDGDLFGPTLNRASRILAAAHGGQVVASSPVADAVQAHVPIVDLGLHRLRDLLEPEVLHQVVVDDVGAYPPLRSLDSFDHNLPAQRTRLIGREADVATVRRLLSEHRLVTLTGIGGVGKTRLALEVAAQELDDRAGAVFADLAPVASGDDVVGVVASSAGLPSGDPEAVMRLFASRPMLLLLDNCEHVLDACADLAEAILDRCPTTVILSTSREPLGIDAERVWRVPSLTEPDAARDLFMDRARAVGAELDDGPITDALVADVCERLDGIPLAIELAASRTSHLSLADLAARLQERFQLLTGGHRRSQPRHQTLRAMLDWSHDLLDEDERRLLRRSSVFVGGFGLAGLEAVAGSDGQNVLDDLASLVHRSLVTVVPTPGGANRYRLLETVRLYALDRLAEAGELSTIRDRHASWVRSLLVTDNPGWAQGPPVPDAVPERENILAAIEWVETSGDLADLGRLATAALITLGVSAWTDDGWPHFDRPEVEAVLTGEDLARYLIAGAAGANTLGDLPHQAQLAERARGVAERGGAIWRLATAALANALSVTDPRRSAELSDELLSSIPGDRPAELGQALARAADAALMTLDLDEGARCLEAAADAGHVDADLGVPELLLGRVPEARRAVDRLERLHGDAVAWAGYRVPLLAGLIDAVDGWPDAAVAHLVDAARLAERLPLRLVEHDVLNGFAVLDHHLGDHTRAAWLLAVVSAGPMWGRTPGMFALHVHYRRLVRAHVTSDEIAALRARAQGTTVMAVLHEEIARHGAG